MKVLFCFQSIAQSRHFLRLLRKLGERGDEVTLLAVEAGRSKVVPPYLRDVPGLRFLPWPDRDRSFWARHSDPFRMARSAAFFADERFRDAAEIRRRVYRALDPALKGFGSGSSWGKSVLGHIERAIPPSRDILAAVRATNPDVVLVSPLVNHLMGGQTDFVKASHALGIPVALPVFSWDNLSSKGVIHTMPDRVFVWNQVQVEEVVGLHHADPAIVSRHGAWRFDDYRALAPTIDYETFCRLHGCDPSKRTILYLGSSPLIAPREGDFAAEWLARVRGSDDPLIARANVLFRAHPRNVAAWKELLAAERPERVAFQDPESLSFFDEQPLFDTIHHSDACFAVNTSAVLEAAIQGKPVLTILHPAIAEGQKGTLHFEYLTTAGGGLLHQATNFDEHLAELGEVLRREAGASDERAKCFAHTFLDHPEGCHDCSASLLAGIDETARLKKTPARRGVLHVMLDWGLRGLIALGLLPITPVINPQINSAPSSLRGRGIPAVLRDPLSLPLFRPVWRRRFAEIAEGLKGILAENREVSYAEAVFIRMASQRFAHARQSRVLEALYHKAAKRLAPKNAKAEQRLAAASEECARLLAWAGTRGGSKYILEELISDLEETREDAKRCRGRSSAE